MIIHEYTNYYDRDKLYVKKKNPSITDFNSIKNAFYNGSEQDKEDIFYTIHSMINNGFIISPTRKQRNTLFQLVKEIGIKEKDLYSKFKGVTPFEDENLNSKDYTKSIKNIIQNKNKDEIRDVLKSNLSHSFFNQAKERYDAIDKLTIADNKLDDETKKFRKKNVMKEWEQRNQKWKEKHDKEKRRKMLVGGIGLAGVGTAYLAARKLAKLKGLENKYARKLLLLPPNKRNFVQKIVDKIRALIRKYKH